MQWFSVSDWFLLNVVVCVLTTVWVTIYPEPEGFKNLLTASGNSNQNCLHQNFLKESDEFTFTSRILSNCQNKTKIVGGGLLWYFSKIICYMNMNFHVLAVLVNSDLIFFTQDYWITYTGVWWNVLTCTGNYQLFKFLNFLLISLYSFVLLQRSAIDCCMLE